ncbi:restriction endonuclease subunit S [Desulfonatronum thiodismutans]|uniref:restriction endonuclease subunit S n=1 Tax=Desulfonatronum thiodismutans TaxID=159290 RepID=UPI000AB81DD1|nr:restriction endonuclease subunit S [Desulfonatronum thiodismutans]
MWEKMRISDFGMVVTGKTPSSNNLEFFGDTFPFITPTDMGSCRIVDTERGISNEGYNKFKRQILPPKSICFVCIGATIGKICLTTKDSLTNQQINSVVVNKSKHNPFFVYYLLSTLAERVKGIASGAATPIVNKTTFEDIEVKAPPLPTQRKIASILSAYDDLIENNQRRIKILEEMAQNLYREWFVKFRFPGHEKVKFVESPLGRIPEGWEVRELGDILKLNYGKALKKEDRVDGDIPVYGSSGIVGYHRSAIASGPGIIVGRKGNVGSIFWSDSRFYPIDTVYFVTSNIPLRFLFYDLQTKNFLNNDAAVPGLNRNQAYSLNTVIPSSDLLAKFCQFADDFEQQASALRQKNSTLRRTRDLLLPKLISGEIDVSDLDIAAPEEVEA